uniref:U3 small nucleolar RNA-associated protein 10 n=1 Tax=Lygus hesperus TaxID=30085 RepID=A0A0A9X9S0_LYGHE
MDDRKAQILVGATAALGAFEVTLYLKNLTTAFSMDQPTDYEGMKGDDFINLRAETITRCRYEIAGAVLNCGHLVAKIYSGYYPFIWYLTFNKLGKSSFLAYWIFQLVDTIMNKFFFAPIAAKVNSCRGTPGLKMRSLAKGHSDKFFPLGLFGLAIMIFAEDVNPKIWFFLPFVSTFDEILFVSVRNRHCLRLIRSDPDSPITKRVRDVASMLKYPVKNIYKDPKEEEIPEVNYYEVGNLMIVSDKMLRLPENIVAVLISQEIGLYSKRSAILNFTMAVIRWVGLGSFLVASFGNDRVCQVFGFGSSPYPYVPMYLAYAYIWPVFSNILYRVECLVYSWNVLNADAVIHQSMSTQGIPALKAVAGTAEKYPIFDTWYSQLMRGYPTVAQRVKNLESLN